MANRPTSSLFLGLAVFVATGVAFSAGRSLRGEPKAPPIAVAKASPAPLPGAKVAEGAGAGLPLTGAGLPYGGQVGFSPFETVYALLREHYVDTLPEDTKMAQGAVKAMLASLEDPNAYFVEADQRTLLENEGKGVFAGIGAALSVRGRKQDGYTEYKVHVVAPLPGSPAEKAGLRAGDVVVRIDGRWVLGYNPLVTYNKVLQRWQDRDVTDEEVEKVRVATKDKIAGGIPFHDAEMLLRGDKAGFRNPSAKEIAKKSSWPLVVERRGVQATITVEPGSTQVPGVASRTLEGGVGYLRIPYFADGTAAAVRKAVAGLPPGGLVVDLRGNPGGSLEAGQAVAGALLGKGAFAQELGPKARRTVLNTTGDPARKGPVTVLVDRGTASVAEALAACVVDRGAGTTVGSATFGDALVQALYTLDDGSGFTLSVGTLTGPKGGRWSGTGIVPKVALAPGTPEDKVLTRAVAALKELPAVAAGGK
ncbi:MAG: S41 family peptidase [Armatimonadota bacterium]